jgi:hypothetical protein
MDKLPDSGYYAGLEVGIATERKRIITLLQEENEYLYDDERNYIIALIKGEPNGK